MSYVLALSLASLRLNKPSLQRSLSLKSFGLTVGIVLEGGSGSWSCRLLVLTLSSDAESHVRCFSEVASELSGLWDICFINWGQTVWLCMSEYVYVWAHMCVCERVCVWLCKHVWLCMQETVCVCAQACTCHSMHVKVRGQPPVSFLASILLWGQCFFFVVHCYVRHANWPMSFQLFSYLHFPSLHRSTWFTDVPPGQCLHGSWVFKFRSSHLYEPMEPLLRLSFYDL